MSKIATTTTVSREELVAFLRERHHIVLVTDRQDGRRQMSPVTAGVDGLGRVVISSYPSRAKVVNARRRPEVTLLVLSDDWDDAWVQVEGTCEVLDLPYALDPLVEYYRAISGEHPDWDDYRAAMTRQGKVLLRVTPESWGPVATGGFPPS